MSKRIKEHPNRINHLLDNIIQTQKRNHIYEKLFELKIYFFIILMKKNGFSKEKSRRGFK